LKPQLAIDRKGELQNGHFRVMNSGFVMLNHLKIATWNLNRPRWGSWHKPTILAKLQEVNADIWILTETNSVISPGENYHKPVATQPETAPHSSLPHPSLPSKLAFHPPIMPEF
jgi:hypothetical protein